MMKKRCLSPFLLAVAAASEFGGNKKKIISKGADLATDVKKVDIPSTNTKLDIIVSNTHITIKKDGKNIDIPNSDTFDALKPTQRGIEIENTLANTEYKDLFHIGKENNGYFPLIDFVNEKTDTAISLKTVDTRGKTWVDRMENHIEDLANKGVTIDGKLANMTLDIRVQPGGLSYPRINSLKKYAKKENVQLTIKEFK